MITRACFPIPQEKNPKKCYKQTFSQSSFKAAQNQINPTCQNKRRAQSDAVARGTRSLPGKTKTKWKPTPAKESLEPLLAGSKMLLSTWRWRLLMRDSRHEVVRGKFWAPGRHGEKNIKNKKNNSVKHSKPITCFFAEIFQEYAWIEMLKISLK